MPPVPLPAHHGQESASADPPGPAARIWGALPAALLTLAALFTCQTATAASRPAPAAAQPVALTAAVRPTSQTPTATPSARGVTASPPTIVLRAGDTLWGLARHYGTTVAALQHLNGLGRSTVIYAGHRLALPADSRLRPERTGASGTATTGHASGAGAAAVAFAQRQLGTPYQWGGTGEGGYDCSGLVQAAWHAAGLNLPRTTYAQAHTGWRTTRDALRPGDLVFTNGFGHVQLYVGHGRIIEAAHTGTRVRYAPLPAPADVAAYLHPEGTLAANTHQTRPNQTRPHSAPTTPTPPVTTTPPAPVPAPPAPPTTPTTPVAPPTPAPPVTTAPPASPGPAGGTADTIQGLAAQIFGDQYGCAAKIITRESSWNPAATNRATGAYGLPQALPGSKMAAAGPDWATNPATQLRWMQGYVTTRYGGACAAWAFWQAHSWY